MRFSAVVQLELRIILQKALIVLIITCLRALYAEITWDSIQIVLVRLDKLQWMGVKSGLSKLCFIFSGCHAGWMPDFIVRNGSTLFLSLYFQLTKTKIIILAEFIIKSIIVINIHFSNVQCCYINLINNYFHNANCFLKWNAIYNKMIPILSISLISCNIMSLSNCWIGWLLLSSK